MSKWNWKETHVGEQVQGKNLFTRFVGWVNSLFNEDHAWFDYNKMDSTTNSVVNQVTQDTLTGSQREANAFTAAEAEKQRAWETEMSNTAYQRQVADMRAAGVNPAMAMSSGSGASTPSGAAGSSVSPANGISFSDIMQLIMMPLQKKLINAQAKQAEDLGEAALINAGANVRNAGTNERNAGTAERNAGTNEKNASTAEFNAQTQRMRFDLDKMVAEHQIVLTDQEKEHVAAQMAFIKLQTDQLPERLAIAKKQANAQATQAAAALQNAQAAVRNAAVNEKLSDSQIALREAQTALEWANKEGRDVVNKYLDERQQQELSNLVKEGVKLDAQGRLVDKQGHLVDAQTVKAYVNCATDVSGAVNQWLNPFSKGPGSSSGPGFDLSGAYQGVAYGYD